MDMKALKRINLNKLAQRKARNVAIISSVAIGLVVIGVLVMLHGLKHHNVIAKKQHHNDFSAAIDQVAFIGVHHQELIDQQNQTQSLAKQFEAFKKHTQYELATRDKQIAALKKAQANELTKAPTLPVEKKGEHTQTQGPQIHLHTNQAVSDKTQSNLDEGTSQSSISTLNMFDFSYPEQGDDPKAEKWRHYVPTGSFAQAIVLSGADGDASVNGSKHTAPILMQITGKVFEPNGHTNNLNGCFVTADTFGDISSERNMVRLVTLSCNKKDGQVLDLNNVQGFVTDGKYGVRGRVVTRNGELLFYSGMSGLASGLGDAIKQQYTTQSISPLGSTSTVNNDKTFQYAGASGASTALGKLAEYYIKRADQYHSIVELNPGSHVTIVFQKGFSTDPDAKVNKTSAKQTSHTTVSNETQINLAKELKQAGLGSRIQFGKGAQVQ